jgi:collagen triple helix repeat protein
MLSRLREHFGTAGLVVAIVALVAALAGGAIAANNSGGGKATASAKAKKGPRGPKGAKGDTGAAGPAGPAGTAGAKGADGSNGLDGEQGEKGATGGIGPKGPTGTAGVDGATGPTGPEGVCSTSACTLPDNVVLKGTWAVSQSAAEAGEPMFVPISLGIPFRNGAELSAASYMKEGVEENASQTCKGGAANPVIAPTSEGGYICIFASSETNFNPNPLFGLVFNKLPQGTARQAGMLFEGTSEAAGPVSAYGTWVAVTKPAGS